MIGHSAAKSGFIPVRDKAVVALTAQGAAKQLNGSEYGEEGSRDLWTAMKAAGLVAVFGASDDLVELRGAIDEEIGCYGGGPFYVTPEGLFQDCEHRCVWARGAKDGARKIEAVWADGDVSWSYKTDIPHASFEVMEDGEIYCLGIVFALSDTASPIPTGYAANGVVSPNLNPKAQGEVG